jgi:hypothetical protein
MKPNASLARSAGVVVKNAKAAEDPDASVVHPEGDEELMLLQRRAEELAGRQVQPQPFRRPVELELSGNKRIERLFAHAVFPLFFS